jgi:long-subunit fatty acid transport protein
MTVQKILFTILVLFKCHFTFAQKNSLGTWNIVNLKYTINEKWSFFGEVQIRSLSFYNQFHYHEYKAGVNYTAHPNVLLTLAAGDYDTYKEGGNFKSPKNNDEFRIWPQVTLTQSIKRFKIDQRYRAEFRFTTNGYRNRYRYRAGISYPFGKNNKDYKPFLLNASNEIFFTGKEPYFERNRLLVSIGYKPTKQLAIQMGYLHQFDYKINDETGRDFLQLGLYIELLSNTKNKNKPRQ